jgi:5S rRNA maturation endonuclease (ribonuclease M5)
MTDELRPPEGVDRDAWTRISRREGDRWAIPERNELGEVIGMAYRDRAGRKDFIAGGSRGLIVAWPLDAYAGSSATDPVLIAEGASDTAALLGLGYDAVGAPMAGACSEMLAALLADRHVAIVADADTAGRNGATKLAAALASRCKSVRTIEPPSSAKDARAAVIAGATREAWDATIAGAVTMTLPPEPDSIQGGPVIVRLPDVKPELVAWLWPGRIAIGKLTLIAGDPGLGKSFLTLDMAARVSRGRAWPDAPSGAMTPGGVVLLSAEDGIADTIRPRLDAAGADVSRIAALEAIRTVGANGRESARTFDLSRDLPALESAIQSVDGCRLVVIDPVTAYLGGVDSHKNAEIRGLLAPLGAIAERYGVAIVAVTHLNKSGGGPAIYRAMGSLAFAAAARAAWAVSKDRDDPRRRLLLPIKNNIAPDTGGLAYRIEPMGVDGCPVVAWEPDAVALSADDALAGDRDEGGGRTERDDAAEWLADLLAHGPRPARDVEREARDAGHSIATVRRAKAAIGVVSRKPAFDGPWEWTLPTPSQDAQPPKTLTEDAHTRSSERLGEKQAEIDGIPAKMLNREGVIALGDADRLGDTATAAGDGWGEL